MPKLNDGLPSFCPSSRQAWREWLEEHHTTEVGVWLIYYKKSSGKPTVTYDEAVEEALCFGWIDSKLQPIDNERYSQLITPRKLKSVWSRVNKLRVAALIEQGLMTAAGLAKIEAAKADGSWTTLDAVEALILSSDLEQALAADKAASDNFAAFSNSSKKNILWWIESAKRPETRRRRIEETVILAAQNIKARP